MKQNFWKNKVVTGKTSFFVVGYFILTILFVLTLPSDIAVLYGKDALSVLLLSTEKRYFSFLRKVFVLKKICFKVNDTHGERLVFHSIQYRNGRLAASDLLDLFTQSIKFCTFHYQHRFLKNVIHRIDIKNVWLLLSASLRQNLG